MLHTIIYEIRIGIFNIAARPADIIKFISYILGVVLFFYAVVMSVVIFFKPIQKNYCFAAIV